jgi:arylsulfatase A-like enzyme
VTRAATAAAAWVALLSLAELALWSRAGLGGDAGAIVAATLALAAAAGLVAAALARVVRPELAAGVGAGLALWPFAAHVVAMNRVQGGAALGIALALAAFGGAVASALARHPRAPVLTALAAVLALAPVGLAALRGATPARPDAAPGAGVEPPDVVLIVLDTTRRDHLSLYGYPEPTTPHLDALARRAQVYDDAWSVSPWTSPSHASLFTGLLPAEHDADGVDAPPLPAGLATLPGVLRDAGYVTGGFAANPNLHAPGWSRDFDVYEAPWIAGAHTLVRPLNAWLGSGSDPWKVDDATRRVLADARRWWAANDDAPRFLFVNVLDPHGPYLAPPDDIERFVRGRDCRRAAEISYGGRYEYADTRVTRAERACIAALYDAELHAMDRELGAFFDWLAGRGELDAALVAVTSDHGERLGESGHVGHLLEMDQHLLRVPLIVRYPPVLAPERISDRVLLTGLPGFVLGLIGVRPPAAMARRSFHATRGEPAVAQHRNFGWYLSRIQKDDAAFDVAPFAGDWLAVADDRFLLRWSPSQGPDSAELFDYRLDADLAHDLADERPEALEALREIARGLPAFPEAPSAGARAPLDPQLRERLRDLGYGD